MSLLVPERVDEDELLDEHDAPWDDMLRSLRDLRAINRYAGGVSAYGRLLRRLAEGRDLHTLRILDIGTGTGDLPLSVGCSISPLGLDFNIRHLASGRSRWPGELHRVAGDAFHLPLRDDSVDVVTSSHFAHHFSEEQNVAIWKESLRVARLGIAITDTRRHLAPLAFVRALGALGLVGRITQFDAPASVLRGYTVPEVRKIAAGIDGKRREVRSMVPFRWGLLIWK